LETSTFSYRILIVDDDPSVRRLGKDMLEAQGYEVLCAEDGFEGLAALKQSLPDIIISDLRMPNMNGFEFLSVVRRRFPIIPVIVISGEFSGLSIPNSVLADAFFPKAEFKPEELFEKICDLVHELPTRPKTGKSNKAAVWVMNDKGTIAVTCTECLRTFPVVNVCRGDNEAECYFCSCVIPFEIIGDDPLVKTDLSLATAVNLEPIQGGVKPGLATNRSREGLLDRGRRAE
jgi:CheY-like chemotaxis protein